MNMTMTPISAMTGTIENRAGLGAPTEDVGMTRLNP